MLFCIQDMIYSMSKGLTKMCFMLDMNCRTVLHVAKDALQLHSWPS